MKILMCPFSYILHLLNMLQFFSADNVGKWKLQYKEEQLFKPLWPDKVQIKTEPLETKKVIIINEQ